MRIEDKDFGFPNGFDPNAIDLICKLMRLNPIERLGFTIKENIESFPKEKFLKNKEIDFLAETYMNYLRNLKNHPFLEADMMEGKKIGWIGTGVMGKSMAEHLNKKGYTLLVHNRSKAKTDELVAHGATYVDSAKALAEQVDYLFLMVGYPRDVESIVFDPEHGIIDAMKNGSYFIDHTSSSPDLAKRIATEF